VATNLQVFQKNSGAAGEEGDATPGHAEEEKKIPPAAYMTLSFVIFWLICWKIYIYI